VIESEAFLELSLEAIDLIISNEHLDVSEEILVFKAAVKYG
jgi:hypothetical protein